MAFERFGDSYYFIKRQLAFGLLVGLVAAWLLYHYDYRRLERWALPLFACSLFLLVLVFVPSIGESYGTFAHRWLRLGPISFQPSEFVKLAFLIYLASWLGRRHGKLADFKEGFLPYAVILGVVLGLILLQPDIGTAAIVAMVAMGVYWLAGGPLRYLALLLLGGVVALVIIVQVKPHAAARLAAFVNPSADPQGIGYHINQAYLAIGSGGLLGRGFGQSRAKFLYLPEVYGDSIFAVVGEELGFVLSLALVAAFLYLCLRGFKVARSASDEFGRLLAGGIVIWFTGQAFINISAMIGLLPLTGIPLPFVSYGSSALAIALSAVGILANISTTTRET